MANPQEAPQSGFAGLKQNWQSDALSGFLVSLIALPLSLGIAGASGFPPIMGVLTAIVGGLVVSLFAGSELTIKGPAAGLIVIVLGAVEELGRGNDQLGWKLSLGCIVAAGVLQVCMGLAGVAKLADFFPLSAVHGMLAAIGIIIMSKQLHFAVGANPAGLKGKEPLELLALIPDSLAHLNGKIALIGAIGLAIMFGMPRVNVPALKRIPPALVVLVVGIGLGKALGLGDPALASLKPLVNPGELQLKLNADFGAASSELMPVFLKYLVLFTLIGSLESVLTGKAIDLLDPYKRKARLSQDLTAVGMGNIVSALLGGLPMISEVARSSANISNGGRTKWANFFHGACLLAFVLLLQPVINMVPIAALAVMLIAVGFRLASPKTFFHAYECGKDQLFVFVATIITTLCTDLLIGVAAGILLEMAVNLVRGLPFGRLFRPEVDVKVDGNTTTIKLIGAHTFSNWIPLQTKLNAVPASQNLVVDARAATLVDHTVMENLLHIEDERAGAGTTVTRVGFEDMKQLAQSPTGARLRGAGSVALAE